MTASRGRLRPRIGVPSDVETAIGCVDQRRRRLDLPIENHLVERTPQGTVTRLSSDKFYVPGSVLEVHVDNTLPLAWGMGDTADVFFRSSPVFRLRPGAEAAGISPIAWFGSEPLRSGWAWGQQYLNGGVAVAAAKVGSGSLYMFGPEILNRGQPHGTFKFFFNGIHLAGAEEVRLDLIN